MKSLLHGLRMAAVCVWFFSISLFLLFVAIFRPFHYSISHLWRRWSSPVALSILGVEVEQRGKEKLELGEGSVIIVNHQSALDMFVFGSYVPAKTVTIGKKSIRYIPFFGWLYYLSGNILIDRKHNQKAVAKIQEAETLIEKGFSILICPEGTRSGNRGFGPFKKGAFHLAVDAQVPIRPFVVSSYYKTLDFGRWKTGKVIVETLEPIPTLGKGGSDIDSVLKLAHGRMAEALQRLDAELSANA